MPLFCQATGPGSKNIAGSLERVSNTSMGVPSYQDRDSRFQLVTLSVGTFDQYCQDQYGERSEKRIHETRKATVREKITSF
jgi:hypothetical protein